MTKKAFVLTLFSVFILIIFHNAFSYQISSCIQINASGYYELTRDISFDSDPCIEIDAPDVVLDCKGFSLSSLTKGYNTAIYLNSYYNNTTNITIKNCKITDSNYGVWKGVYYRDLLTIENTIVTNCKKGIYIYNSNNLTIRNVSISSLGYSDYIYGLYIRDSNYVVVVDSNISYVSSTSSPAYGVNLKITSGKINNTIISHIKTYGIYSDYNTFDLQIINTTIYDNYYGLYLVSNTENLVLNLSKIYNNTENVYINENYQGTEACDNITFVNTTGKFGKPIVYLFNDSITLNYGDYSDVILCGTNNSIIANLTANSGIYAFLSENNTIENVSVKDSFYGIYLSDSKNFTVRNSIFENNTYGIYLDSTNQSKIYNNLFNDSNITIANSYSDYFNTTKKLGKRVFYSQYFDYIGGNFYATYDGIGYSQICTDNNFDGFCDNPFDIQIWSGCSLESCGLYTDFLPLSDAYESLNYSNFSFFGTAYYFDRPLIINITWTERNPNNNVSYVMIQTNITGTQANYTPILIEPFDSKGNGVYSLNFSNIQPGTYFVKSCANNTKGYENCTEIVYFNVTKGNPSMNITVNVSSLYWFETVQINITKIAWVDRGGNYTLRMNSTLIDTFESNNETIKKTYYISNKSSGLYILNFSLPELQNFSSKFVTTNVTFLKGFIKTDGLEAGERYEFDYNTHTVPIEVSTISKNDTNITIEVGKPVIINVTYNITNTNGNSGLQENFTNVIVNASKFMPGWKNVTNYYYVIPNMNYGSSTIISVVYNNTTAFEESHTCTQQTLTNSIKHICTYNILVTDENITQNHTVIFKIQRSSLSDFDSRTNTEYDVDSYTSNVSLNITTTEVVFIVNRSLLKGRHYFHLIYYTPYSSTSSSSSSSSSGSSSGGGGGVGFLPVSTDFVQKIVTITKPHKIEKVKINLGPLEELKLSVKKPAIVERIKVKLKKVKHKPENKIVYKAFEINVTFNESDLITTNLTFYVNNSWIKENDIEPNTVKLYKFKNNKWIELPTTLVNKTHDKYYYEADTKGFSLFAIFGEKKTETEKIVKNETQINETTTEENKTAVEQKTNKSEAKKEIAPKTSNSTKIYATLLTLLSSTVIIYIILVRKRHTTKVVKSKKRRKRNKKFKRK